MSQIKPLWYNLFIVGPVLFDLYNLLAYTVIINSVLAIFNLIPIPPLDGSRILSALLPNKMKIYFDKIERFGMLILLLLLMTNIFNKIISFFLVPMINLLLGR